MLWERMGVGLALGPCVGGHGNAQSTVASGTSVPRNMLSVGQHIIILVGRVYKAELFELHR